MTKPPDPSIDQVLQERGTRYGRFEDHARIVQQFMWTAMGQVSNGPEMSTRLQRTWFSQLTDTQRQALTVIFDKIARILNGDPNYDDNWRDIAGYATLVLQTLEPSNDPATK